MEQTPYVTFESLPVRIREGGGSGGGGVAERGDGGEPEGPGRVWGEPGEEEGGGDAGISLATLYRKRKGMG